MTPVTLRQMAQRILRMLNAGDLTRDKKFEEREIVLALRDAAHYIMKGRWFQAKQMREIGVPAQYITTFKGVDVKKDDDGNNYIDLPAEYIQLPEDAGVRNIWPDISNRELDQTAMIPLGNSVMSSILGRLPAGALEHEFSFYPEQQKVYFEKRFGKTLLEQDPPIKKVKVQLVIISPDQVGLDAHFPAPPDMREEIMTMVLNKYGMGQQQPKDVLNDGSSEPNNAR